MISAVVLSHNDGKIIRRCIKSLLWCDEVIVIDDYSTDKTLDSIASLQKDKIKVFKHKLCSDFARQRNFGLSKAKNEWVLFVDSDERISNELKEEILLVVGFKNDAAGYYIRRRDWFLGRELKHGESGNVKLVRLAKRSAGRWKRKVHEYWRTEGKTGELENPLLHYPHTTLREFVESTNFYSSIHAKENKREAKKSNLVKIIFYPVAKFFVNYFLKFGFLDGIPGFMMATMMSFHSFLSWSKQKNI
jgi:glycosyltransferase involved in cell wall biosynthesis